MISGYVFRSDGQPLELFELGQPHGTFPLGPHLLGDVAGRGEHAEHRACGVAVAWLASVIAPSGLIATSESKLDSIMNRAASNACLAPVMSRAIVDAPMIAPPGSWIGETVNETVIADPSSRTRVASRRSSGWPALILAGVVCIWPA